MMNPGAQVVGYVRISQAESARNGHGLAAQETAIRAECDRRGWSLVEIVRDEGKSGKDAERDGLYQALDVIRRGEAAGLVVAKLDRLSRSVVDFGVILEWLERASASFAALDLGIDTSTTTGRLIANVLVSVAQWEREMIVVRTQEGLAQARRDGKTIGHAAFVDTDEGRKLRERIRRMHKRGMSYGKIAAKLDRDRIKPLRGGDKWSRASVQSACRTEPQRKAPRKTAKLPQLP